jgi:hypothetical protein
VLIGDINDEFDDGNDETFDLGEDKVSSQNTDDVLTKQNEQRNVDAEKRKERTAHVHDEVSEETLEKKKKKEKSDKDDRDELTNDERLKSADSSKPILRRSTRQKKPPDKFY